MSAIQPSVLKEYDFNYQNFSSVDGLIISPDVEQAGDALRLTPAAGEKMGSAWYRKPVQVAYGFETVFSFTITERGGWAGNGGDGFSFNVHNLGFDQIVGEAGTSAKLSVQFDTHQNGGEVSDNFVRINYRGQVAAERDLNALGSPIDMSNGQTHLVWVLLRDGKLSVTIDDYGVASARVDLRDMSPAVVGFGARTGGAWENHDINSWVFKSAAPHIR